MSAEGSREIPIYFKPLFEQENGIWHHLARSRVSPPQASGGRLTEAQTLLNTSSGFASDKRGKEAVAVDRGKIVLKLCAKKIRSPSQTLNAMAS